VFIPPAWKLNDNSIKVLEKLGFRLAEIQKKFVLISQRQFKKIAIPEVLNWDSYGYPHKNIVNIKRNTRRFKFLVKKKSEIIKIALHSRDPFQALNEQLEIVSQLIDQRYKLVSIESLYLYYWRGGKKSKNIGFERIEGSNNPFILIV